ncbi:MAG TPA: NUDIX domain-containing protein [Pseudolysinimonas sp.]|jgi:8-oxo-dGTP pyrophosphatase MutT (NUDIX family)
MIERNAARVIVLDENHRTLLFRGGDPARPEAGTWWFTPGGGLEPGESTREAAARELREETGLSGSQLHGPIHRRVTEFLFDGEAIRQDEEYFFTVVPTFEVSAAEWTDLEKRVMIESRWWSLDELERTTETVYPIELSQLVGDLRNSR